MKTIGRITVFIIAVFGGSIWSGYVLSILWRWFVVPTFGLPQLGINAAIGVSLITSYLTRHATPEGNKQDSKKDWWIEAIVRSALVPAFALCAGWIVHLFSNPA